MVVALVAAALLLAARPAQADATFTVNSTGDRSDQITGNGRCFTGVFIRGSGGAKEGECTLRAALQEANATTGADTIRFNIPDSFGTGVKTIKPNSFLPTITEQVTIDGYTQPGASPNTSARGTDAVLFIELNGENLGATLGLDIEASNSVIRGLVVNSFGRGIDVHGSGNRIEGNFIGTDPSGTQDLGHFGDGVFIYGGTNNTVGGTTKGARNLISGNGDTGVSVQNEGTTGTKVQGNLIGTKADGTSALGNSSHGVLILEADNTVVGGTGAANTIAFNGGDGVSVDDGVDSISGDIEVARANKVLGNSIFSNAGLGIDLVPEPDEDSRTDVPTANDGGAADDSDDGANGLQNKPALSSATSSGGTTTIAGVLDTKPDTTLTVQFFSNPSGNEGKKFIGSKSVTTGSDGNVTFTFTPAQAVAVGQTITATATSASGDTSEFSAPKGVVQQ